MGDGLQQQLVNKPALGCGVGQIVIQSSKLSQMLLAGAGAHFDTFLQNLAVTCAPHVASRSPDFALSASCCAISLLPLGRGARKGTALWLGAVDSYVKCMTCRAMAVV